jgi:tRNA-splicing ligase RtcB (3'-phosphate/5'-hydroxy nucleic acid ligase)
MQIIDGIVIYGEPIDQGALDQIKNCQRQAECCALMGDHHLGYAMPIGGVCAYRDKISPSGVGFDIACGNKAVKLDIPAPEVKKNLIAIMDDIFSSINFGVGRKNADAPDHELFDDEAWKIPAIGNLYDLARQQLGTVGSGNHYVDLFVDEDDHVWCGVHFGSRGLGHKIASHYIQAGGGKDGMFVDPVLLDVNSSLGQEYLAGMKVAGKYAYAGRDWVCQKVADLLGARILEEVHNHHNFAWQETHDGRKFWVVRKGATPAFPGQLGFVGGSMGDDSVILRGKDSEESRQAMYSTVHGAGRVMSRTQAAGKRRWQRGGVKRVSSGQITRAMMREWVEAKGVELRGAGTDESPHCYKRLEEVLKWHKKTVEIVHVLKPIGVAMAGEDEYDPYKD